MLHTHWFERGREEQKPRAGRQPLPHSDLIKFSSPQCQHIDVLLPSIWYRTVVDDKDPQQTANITIQNCYDSSTGAGMSGTTASQTARADEQGKRLHL